MGLWINPLAQHKLEPPWPHPHANRCRHPCMHQGIRNGRQGHPRSSLVNFLLLTDLQQQATQPEAPIGISTHPPIHSGTSSHHASMTSSWSTSTQEALRRAVREHNCTERDSSLQRGYLRVARWAQHLAFCLYTCAAQGEKKTSALHPSHMTLPRPQTHARTHIDTSGPPHKLTNDLNGPPDLLTPTHATSH